MIYLEMLEKCYGEMSVEKLEKIINEKPKYEVVIKGESKIFDERVLSYLSVSRIETIGLNDGEKVVSEGILIRRVPNS